MKGPKIANKYRENVDYGFHIKNVDLTVSLSLYSHNTPLILGKQYIFQFK